MTKRRQKGESVLPASLSTQCDLYKHTTLNILFVVALSLIAGVIQHTVNRRQFRTLYEYEVLSEEFAYRIYLFEVITVNGEQHN